MGKLLTLGSPKEDRHWVFRRFSAERRRELTQHLFDELDRQEDEPAEIRRRLEMVQRAKRAVALVDEYGKLRNELIDATPSWFHWLVPPPFRPALSSEQHSREMRELRWRLSRLASRHATDELHDRIDRVLEELADLRARILETDPPPESLHDEVERQRRAAARTRAKELFQRLIAIRQECFTLIRESEGIAQEAALDRLLEGCTSDGSGSGLAFAEGAKLQDVRQVERPPYLAFLNELFDELGLEAIERLKKEDLRGEIRKRWPPEFGLHPAKDGLQPSKNLVDPMATILRSLEAKRGGARRQRPR